MNCRDVDNLLLSHASGAPIPPAAAGHIAACDRCGPLVRALAEPVDAPPPAPERLRTIEAALLEDLQPVKPLASANLLSLALIGALLVVAVAGVAVLGLDGWRVLACGGEWPFSPAWLPRPACWPLRWPARRPGGKLLLPPYWLLAAIGGSLVAILAALFQPHAEATFIATGLVRLEIGIGLTPSPPPCCSAWRCAVAPFSTPPGRRHRRRAGRPEQWWTAGVDTSARI